MAVVNLKSLDVVAIFHELRNTTGLFRVWKETGDDIATQCPFHGGGVERNPSFGICVNKHNPNYGQYHCFACGASGTIIGLANLLHNKPQDDNFGIEVAQAFSDVELADVRNQINLLPRKKVVFKEGIPAWELISYRQVKSDYLTGRRIKPVIQDAFDCGYDPDTQSVTFPVRRGDGVPLFVVRRSVNLKWYNYPAGVKKPLYGVYELSQLAPKTKQVVVVESIINALTLWGLQIPAIALLGTGSRTQIEYLNAMNVRSWVLALDGDSAGEQATRKLKSRLKAHTTVMPIPPGFDVNDLDSHTIAILHTLRR